MAKKQISGASMFERAGKAMGIASLQQQGAYQQAFDVTKGITQGIKMSNAFNEQEKKVTELNPDGLALEKIPAAWQNAYVPWATQKKNRLAELKQVLTKGINSEGYADAAKEADAIEKSFLNFNNKMEQYAKAQTSVKERAFDNKYGKANSMTSGEKTNFNMVFNNSWGENAMIDENGNPVVLGDGNQPVDLLEIATNTGRKYDKNTLERPLDVFYSQAWDAGKTEKSRLNWAGNGAGSREQMIRDLETILEDNPKAAKDIIYQDDRLMQAMMLNAFAGVEEKSFNELLMYYGSADEEAETDEEKMNVGLQVLAEEMKNIDPQVFSDYLLENELNVIDQQFEKSVNQYMPSTSENINTETSKGKFNNL
jgi:hypothetical protein